MAQDLQKDTFSTNKGELTIHFVKHASLFFEFDGKIIHIDPVSRMGSYETYPDAENNENGRRKVKLIYPVLGILLAFGGALGQAGGLVLSKYGMKDYDPFAATQIRVITGVIGFSLIFLFTNSWSKLTSAFKNRKAMTRLSIGAFFGPFLGVSFSLLSVKHTSTGIASTIMSIVPVLIIAPAVIFLKEKLTIKEVIGSIIAVGGVVLFFL